ncbi:dTMP kinase [Parachlamydia sp. AcF125]|uniref:dTMP kinase n=1 Tax=Parachlamydia sp. AcF125 TaxID=2795736 RepID=UPI001BC966E0|nr:dTMP kinase [Parachlamydia sp. AcF125]MBS4168385.1 Thymidylate kinase [Parachlamydia sp. AcF125]
MHTMKKHPCFITFEGGEGAGKTTLIQHVEADLKQLGYDVVSTREPGGSALGNTIRQWLLQQNSKTPISIKAELLLFLAARAQHIEELILPSLAKGKIVLCDRFNDSTIAYQGVARGLGLESVQKLCEFVCASVVPDLTLYLDIDPHLGLARTQQAAKEDAPIGSIDRIESEKLEFHERVRKGFIKLIHQNPERYHVIDASQSPELVWRDARETISRLLSDYDA